MESSTQSFILLSTGAAADNNVEEVTTTTINFVYNTTPSSASAAAAASTLSGSPDTTVTYLPCDNSRNLLTPHVAEMVDLVLFVGVLPVLVAIGVSTNVINMVVFARQGLADRINMCLFSLALVDAGFLLFLMCGKSYPLVSLVDREAGIYWQKRYMAVVLGTYVAFFITSNAVTAIIAMERCFCVISPFKAKKVLKTKYLSIVIVVIGVFSFVVKNLALNLKYQTVKVQDPLTNATTYISRLSSFYLEHRTVIDAIYIDFTSVFLSTLSLVVVIVCTSVTILSLKVSVQWRKTMNDAASQMSSSERKRETAVTRMLLTVCGIYVICMTPSVARTLMFTRLPGFLMTGHLCNVYKVVSAAVHLMEATNSASTFFIYLRQSSRFRTTLAHLCRRCSGKYKEGEGMPGRGASFNLSNSRVFTSDPPSQHSAPTPVLSRTLSQTLSRSRSQSLSPSPTQSLNSLNHHRRLRRTVSCVPNGEVAESVHM